MSKNKKFIDEKFEVSLDNAIHFINTKNLIKAKVICRKLIDDEINAFDAHQLMGSILLYEEQPLEALGYFDKALLINNKVSLVWSNRSVALMNLGKFQDALSSVNQALSLDHQFADALFNKANILSKMNRYDEALIFIDDYLAQKPNVGPGWTFKGNFHFKLKQFNTAIPAFQEALRFDPESLEVLINLGLAFAETGLYEDGIAYLEKALKISPNTYQIALNMGVVFDKMGKFQKAKEYMQQAKQLSPNSADVLLNLGIVCQKVDGALDDSLSCFNRLITSNAKNSIYYFNRGVTLDRLTRLDEAIHDYDNAIALSDKVSSIQPRWNRSLSLLCNGDLQRGWEEYETRFELDQMENKVFHQANFHKRWNGDPNLIKAKQFLVLAEQGLGDTFQFSRYIRYLVEMGADITFMVQSPLMDLYKSFTVPVRLLDLNQPAPYFDYYCSLMSLPHLLRDSVHGISSEIFYLKADPIKVEKWATRLGPPSGKRVGLIWSGGFRPDPGLWLVNKRRNIELSKLSKLKMDGIEFHSLQIGELPESELLVHYLQNWEGPKIENHAEYLKDFSETAALLENLDLLISVDTSTPHLAGVLGKPVWLLNRFDTCWRWMLQRSDTPWYPSFRIFRQKAPDDWGSVVDEVKEALQAFVKT